MKRLTLRASEESFSRRSAIPHEIPDFSWVRCFHTIHGWLSAYFGRPSQLSRVCSDRQAATRESATIMQWVGHTMAKSTDGTVSLSHEDMRGVRQALAELTEPGNPKSQN